MRSASEILDEIRRLKSLDSDTLLGALFGVKQSTVASWRARNSIPYEEIIAFCVREGISTDQIFIGTPIVSEPIPRYGGQQDIDPKTELIVKMLKGMPEEQKEKVRIYAADQKQIADCLVALSGGVKKGGRGAA